MNKRILKLVGVIFLVSLLFGYFSNDVESARSAIEKLMSQLQELFHKNHSTFDMAVALFKNNTVVCIFLFLLGFIPFLYLPVLPLIINGHVLGIGLRASKASLGKTLLLGILPHGIFELTALLLSAMWGLLLCHRLTKKILRQDEKSILELAKEGGTFFILRIIPLLFVAAIVEAYITPVLFQ